MGHPPDSKLHSLSHVLPILHNSCNKDCIVCTLAKQKRLHFPFNNNLSNCSFYLIHMDVWGPCFVPTSEGIKYILIMVDDATRATWIFLIKSKSEVITLILSFYTTVHTQCRLKIKSITSNNALEFKLSFL